MKTIPSGLLHSVLLLRPSIGIDKNFKHKAMEPSMNQQSAGQNRLRLHMLQLYMP